jgi:transposase
MARQSQVFEQFVRRQVAVQLGAFPILERFLNTLQIRQTVNEFCPTQSQVDFGRVVEVLIANRLTAPRPLYQVGTWLETTVLPALWEIEPSQFNDDRLARCLDALPPHIEDLWMEGITRAVLHYEVDVSCLLYDLTSFYFEGESEGNDFMTYGYSHDERPHTQQVVTATAFTRQGAVPLDYRLLPGNTAEASTVIENMQRVRRLLKRWGKPPNLIVISDASLLSADIIAAYHQQPMGYLGRRRECPPVQQWMRSVSKEELLLHPLAYRAVRLSQQEEPAYYGVVREWSVTVGNQTVKDQALIVYSPAKERLDAHKREQALSKLTTQLDTIARRLNQRRYKQADDVHERIEKVMQGSRAGPWVRVRLEGQEGHLRLHYE